ncbi:anti-sigma factor antagonist [Rhodobacterales bacterium HKCCE2091]|nr:anti-sigma factor antagonist [Rhodobacterales bacterium HKCCE2091]
MKLDVNREGPVTVVTVAESRIDAAAAVDFKDAFRAVATDSEGDLVLDLTAVDFLDSSGLGAVVAARKLLGGTRALDLAGLTDPVARVMQLTRMDTVFRIHATADAAREAYRSSAA